jgi:hypothetical protein
MITIDEYDILLDLLGYKNPEIEIPNNSFNNYLNKINKLIEELGLNFYDKEFKLVLWNDDVNVVDNVSYAINDICGIENAEAYKITLDAHLKGKSVIKNGKLTELLDLQKRMHGIGIKTTVK